MKLRSILTTVTFVAVFCLNFQEVRSEECGSWKYCFGFINCEPQPPRHPFAPHPFEESGPCHDVTINCSCGWTIFLICFVGCLIKASLSVAIYCCIGFMKTRNPVPVQPLYPPGPGLMLQQPLYNPGYVNSYGTSTSHSF